MKNKKQIPVRLTNQELNLLAKAKCQCEETKRASLFSALTGIRFNEIEALKWKDIALKKGGYSYIILMRPKTGDTFHIPLTMQTIILLGKPKKPMEKVFTLHSQPRTNHYIKRWAERAGINKNISFNTFRYSFVVMMLTHDVSFHTIATMLGHKSVKPALKYIKRVEKVNLGIL